MDDSGPLGENEVRMQGLKIVVLTFVCCMLAMPPSEAARPASRTVAFRQIDPDGELKRVACREEDPNCVSEVMIYAKNKKKLITITIITTLTSDRACFKFKSGDEELFADNTPYYYCMDVDDGGTDKKVSLYPVPAESDAVLRYSEVAIADLEIVVFPAWPSERQDGSLTK